MMHFVNFHQNWTGVAGMVFYIYTLIIPRNSGWFWAVWKNRFLHLHLGSAQIEKCPNGDKKWTSSILIGIERELRICGSMYTEQLSLETPVKFERFEKIDFCICIWAVPKSKSAQMVAKMNFVSFDRNSTGVANIGSYVYGAIIPRNSGCFLTIFRNSTFGHFSIWALPKLNWKIHFLTFAIMIGFQARHRIPTPMHIQ